MRVEVEFLIKWDNYLQHFALIRAIFVVMPRGWTEENRAFVHINLEDHRHPVLEAYETKQRVGVPF